jgi:hypothetical protein
VYAWAASAEVAIAGLSNNAKTDVMTCTRIH